MISEPMPICDKYGRTWDDLDTVKARITLRPLVGDGDYSLCSEDNIGILGRCGTNKNTKHFVAIGWRNSCPWPRQ